MWKPGRRKYVKHGRPKCEKLDAENIDNMDVQNMKTWTPKTCKTWTSKMWKPGRPWTENMENFNEIWLLESFFQPTKNHETMEKNL